MTGDALRFVRAGSGSAVAGEIVVDNLAAVKAGAWTLDVWTGGGALWGANHEYRASGGTGANSMTWTPALASAGRYRVYARWSAHSLRAPDARYTVSHDGGATEVTVDQRGSGGIWVALGSYDLTPGQGHGVVLSDEGGGFNVSGDAVRFVPEANSRAVMADAVKLVPAQTPAFPAASSTLATEYVYLNGRPLALIDGGTLTYVHTDHLGTPQKMTDGTGAVVWDAVYRPFGEAESITGSAQNDQRFPGQLYDPETGFHYNYFRDYAPELGRYVESDPIGLRGGLNTYAYAYSNPVLLVDPLGLESIIGGFGLGFAPCRLNYPSHPIRKRGRGDLFFGIPYPAGRDECGNCNGCTEPVYWASDGPGHGSVTVYYKWITWNQTNDEDCCCVPKRGAGAVPPAGGMLIP